MPDRRETLNGLTDRQLLKLRFSELPISLEGTRVARYASRVFRELKNRGVNVKPSIWLSEEWFNPEGVVGFAIPFYLAHPRLIRLERRLMLEAEGASVGEAMSIIRHETGHAVDEAFQFHRRKEYARVFGSPKRAYPSSYTIVAESRDHVTHLNAWYAQSHPYEDFAETFATWLLPKRVWRSRYRNWPALDKLETVDQWLSDCKGRTPRVKRKDPSGELQDNDRTLAQHYEEKRSHYRVGATKAFDKELQLIFAKPRRSTNADPTAISFLRTVRSTVRKSVANPLGVPAYTVDQVLRQLILRAAAMDLRLTRSDSKAQEQITGLVTRVTSDMLRTSLRLPL